MPDTLMFITGATEGIGLNIAKQVPHPDTRIINFSRRRHPDYETVQVDLADPASWEIVRAHVNEEMARFKGSRALFFQNAYFSEAHGVMRNVDTPLYTKGVLVNVAAPLVMGQIFLRACKPDYEAGLVMMSAGAAAWCLEGLTAYAPGKIGLEHWSQIASRELESWPEPRPWVVALRLGGVATNPVLRAAANADGMPRSERIRDNIKNRLTPEAAAAEVWKVLPPPPGISVMTFGDDPDNPEMEFDGHRLKRVHVPGWKLVYR